MQSVTAKDGQTLFDIAVQAMGLVDGVFQIAELNDMSITDLPFNGQVLKVPDPDFEHLVIRDFYLHPWFPACGDPGDFEILGGIGYMQIGSNFKVS